MELDLDAARAARAEANGESKVLRFGGETFELPSELWVDAAEAWEVGNWREGFRLMLGDEAWERFKTIRMSTADLKEASQGVVKMYGTEQGESSASSGS